MFPRLVNYIANEIIIKLNLNMCLTSDSVARKDSISQHLYNGLFNGVTIIYQVGLHDKTYKYLLQLYIGLIKKFYMKPVELFQLCFYHNKDGQ